MWLPVLSAFKKAFAFLKSSPAAQLVLIGLAAWFGHARAIAKAKKVAETAGEIKHERKVEKNNETVRKRIEKAENAITRDLNNRSLRELTKNDPHNAGRPKRD